MTQCVASSQNTLR